LVRPVVGRTSASASIMGAVSQREYHRAVSTGGCAAPGRCVMSPASIVSPSLSLFLLAQPTPLVCRSDELATIRQRLAGGDTHLLPLTGPTGVGKTRLALAAAGELAAQSPAHFPDGVAMVDLAPVREPPLVLPTIARTLGLTDTGQPPLA